MKALLLCVALAVCGCSSGAPDQKVSQLSQERKAELEAFRSKFDPIHQQLAAELSKPNFGGAEVYEQIAGKLDKLRIAPGVLASEERFLVARDKLACVEAGLYLGPYSDASIKASTQPILEKRKADTAPYAKLEHLASSERVRFELESKPIDPARIKIGAQVVDGESGSPVGYITNPDFRKDDKIFVCTSKTHDGAADNYIERHLVESGIDYRIAD